jgi:peptide-methionine (R)-S-oxide reductase
MSTPKQQDTDQDWKNKLTEEQYHVLREAGTERAFTGKYNDHHEDGMYHCAGCGAALFGSDQKFDSTTGWPSFSNPVNRESLTFHEDTSYGMNRIEVRCKACEGHLGHVFPAGFTKPDEHHYCINSCALQFQSSDDESTSS